MSDYTAPTEDALRQARRQIMCDFDGQHIRPMFEIISTDYEDHWNATASWCPEKGWYRT